MSCCQGFGGAHNKKRIKYNGEVGKKWKCRNQKEGWSSEI